MKTCSACKQTLHESCFSWKKRNNTLQSTCRACSRERSKAHYQKNKDKYRQNRDSFKKKVLRFVYQYYQQHPCIDCGESDPVVLQFDHQDNKKMCVSIAVKTGWGIERITKEIEKCVVRCANCHIRKTAKDQKWYRSIGE